MKNKLFKTCLTSLALSVAGLASADSVSLGSASAFTVLSASGAVNCTNSTIEGDVGSAVAGTRTSCVQSGDIVTAVSQDIQTDFRNAYSTLASEQCDHTLATLAGQVLTPGTYCVDNASTNTGSVLTLNGDDDDTWLFKIGTSGAGALTGTDFVVEMSGGAQACNVSWWVADAVTLTRGDFKGDILAGQAVTVTGVASNSPVKGRIMAEGTVVLTNADALGCVAEAAARTAEAIAAAEAAQLVADNAAAAALLVVVNDALDVVIGPDGRAGLIGDTGPTGPAGADSTVAGPAGPAGANSTVAGPTGPAGADGTNGTNAVMPTGADPGDILYWDGSVWQLTPEPANPECGKLILTLIAGVPTWTSDSICIDGGYTVSVAPLFPECPVWTAEDLKAAPFVAGTQMEDTFSDGSQVILLTTGTYYDYYDSDHKEYTWQMNVPVHEYHGFPHGSSLKIYDSSTGRYTLNSIPQGTTLAQFDACGVLLQAAVLAGSN